MKNVVITILVMLVLCLGGFIIYDKFMNEKVEESKTITNEIIKTMPYVDENNGIPYITLEDFEEVNTQISQFNSNEYTYHVYKNILFLNLKRYMIAGEEGIISYLNIYVDLENKTVLNTKQVLDKLHVNKTDFNRYLSQYKNLDSINLDTELYIEPADGLLLVSPTIQATFDRFFVSFLDK